MEFAFESIGPTLRYVVLAFMLFFAIVALLVVVLLAALPGQIAKRTRHLQASAINVCGWLGLPTGVLWVLALVWAYTRRPLLGFQESPSGTTELDEQITRLEKSIEMLEKQLGR